MATNPKTKEPVQKDLLQIAPEEISNEEQIGNEPQEVEVEPSEEEADQKQVDASEALKKQVEALRKSEEINKRRAEESRLEAEKAHRLAQERAAEVVSLRRETLQSQLDTISTALASAQNEAESAKRDMRGAIANGDVDAQTEAFERMATARAQISKFEDGKYELEARIKAAAEAPRQDGPPPLPDRIQRWINVMRPDQETWDKLRAFHHEIIREGIEFDSPEYIEAQEIRLGRRERPKRQEEDRMPENQDGESSSSIVSAPVSRESITSRGTGSSQIRLTAAQREAAKIAGISEKDYAVQLQNLQRMKANGSYGGQP